MILTLTVLHAQLGLMIVTAGIAHRRARPALGVVRTAVLGRVAQLLTALRAFRIQARAHQSHREDSDERKPTYPRLHRTANCDATFS